MKKTSENSVFRKNEFQLRYFTLSISDGVLRYGKDQQELAKNKNAGRHFSYFDMVDIQEDFSNNGRDVDFSGDKTYPFPFRLLLSTRPLVLASKTRQDREMWTRAFKLILDAERARIIDAKGIAHE